MNIRINKALWSDDGDWDVGPDPPRGGSAAFGLAFSAVNRLSMGLLYGRAGRSTAQNVRRFLVWFLEQSSSVRTAVQCSLERFADDLNCSKPAPVCRQRGGRRGDGLGRGSKAVHRGCQVNPNIDSGPSDIIDG